MEIHPFFSLIVDLRYKIYDFYHLLYAGCWYWGSERTKARNELREVIEKIKFIKYGNLLGGIRIIDIAVNDLNRYRSKHNVYCMKAFYKTMFENSQCFRDWIYKEIGTQYLAEMRDYYEPGRGYMLDQHPYGYIQCCPQSEEGQMWCEDLTCEKCWNWNKSAFEVRNVDAKVTRHWLLHNCPDICDSWYWMMDLAGEYRHARTGRNLEPNKSTYCKFCKCEYSDSESSSDDYDGPDLSSDDPL